MPSTLLFVQSGGQLLVSGGIFSGTPWSLTKWQGTASQVGGIQMKLSRTAPDTIYVGLPNLSGTVNTFLSGGSLSSGGMTDGMELAPGDSYFIPMSRLISGIQTPRLMGPATASGGRVFWELI